MITKIFVNTIRCTWTSVRFFSQTTTPSPIRFENFFRQVQKANAVGEVISIFQQQEKTNDNPQYLAITLRILTRNMRKGQREDYQKIEEFLKASFQVMNSLDLSKLKATEIKDFLLFFLHYTEENYKISGNERELISVFLKHFLALYRSFNQKTRVQFLPVFASCVRLAHNAFNINTQQFLIEIQKVIEENSTLFIRDSLTFLSLLKVTQLTFAPYRKCSISFTISLIRLILDTNPQVFTFSSCKQILVTALKIKKVFSFCLDSQITYVDQVISKMEHKIQSSIIEACQKDIEQLVNELLEVDPGSSLVKQIFQMIIRAVGPKGECNINPLIVVFYLPLFRQQHLYLLDNKWGDRFLLFLRKYFDNRLFVRTIDNQLRLIIKSGLFSWTTTQEIYQFYLKYPQPTDKIALFSSELLNAEIHALRVEEQSTVKSLVRIYEWIAQIQSYWSKQVKRYEWIKQSPIQISQSRLKYSSFGQLQYDTFMNELAAKILLTKIRVYYLQNNHKKVENLLSQVSGNSDLSQKTKAELIKGLLIETKLSKNHLNLAQKWLESLFEDNSSAQLQSSVLKVLFDYFKEGNRPFDQYAVNQVWAILEKKPDQIHRVLFLHTRLLHILVHYKYRQISEMVFRWIHNRSSLIFKYESVIYALLCRFSQLASDEALLFWPKLKVLAKMMSPEYQKVIAGFIIKSNISHHHNIASEFKSISLFKPINKERSQISLNELKASYIQNLNQRERLMNELIGLADWDLISRVDQIQMDILPQQRGDQWILLCSRLLRRIEKTKYSFKKTNKFVDKLIVQYAEAVSRFDTSSCLKLEALRFFIDNSIYCSTLNLSNFVRFHQVNESDSMQIIKYTSKYPIIKHEYVMLQNIDHLSIMGSFKETASLFALTDKPSRSLVDWVKKWTIEKSLPLYFHTYLQYLHPQIHKECNLRTFKLENNVNPQLFLEQSFSGKYQDFMDIQTKEEVEGCQKLIIRKILKVANPRQKVSFTKIPDKNEPKKSFFKKQ